MNETLKTLVVGGGSAGVRHFRYLTEYGVKCSVCDPVEPCRVTQEFPDAEHFLDFDAVDLSGFDAVMIATPPFLHVPQAIAAARAGCHILLEKPISNSEEGLDELEQIVEEKGLVASVAYPYANSSAWDRLLEIIDAGEIGDVWMLAAHGGQNILQPRPDYYSTYYGQEALGGGCLQDNMTHAVMAAEMIGGPVAEVAAQRHNIGLENIDTDDTSFVWLKFKSGVVATLDSSLQCHLRHSEWIVSGSAGAVRVDLESEPVAIHLFDAATEDMHEEFIEDTRDESFRSSDKNFVEAIRGNASVRCTLAQARSCLRTILAAIESARLGRTVTIS